MFIVHCRHAKEDELHFLLDCPTYTYYRDKYITKHWSDKNKLMLKDLLNCEDEGKNQDLALYAYYSMCRKERVLENHLFSNYNKGKKRYA